MDTANINTATLRDLLKLTEKRDALLGELKKIEADISRTASGRTAVPAASPAAPKAKRKTRRRRKNAAAPKVAAAPTAPKAAKAVKAPEAKKAAKATTRKSSGKRGALKSRILSALSDAGAKGVTVKDLSKDLGVKSQNIHVWFSSTGKKLKEIQKLGPGAYRLK